MEPIGKTIISIQYGTSQSTSDTGVPVVGMKNIQNGKVDFKNLPCVSLDEGEKNKLLLHDGDILLNRTNSLDIVGKVGLVEKPNGAVFASYLVRLEVDKTKSDPKFVAMWLSSFWAVQMIKKIATRAVSQANINPTEFKKFCLIPILPLPEQKAIVDVLGTWDEAIGKTERLIQSKEKMLDAYARDLFDRKNNGKYKGWKVVKLKTVLHEHGDKSTGDEEVYSVSVHKGLVNQVEHLGRSFSAANTDNYNLVHYGDIVNTKSPTGDFPLGVVRQSYAEDDVIVSPLYGVFTPKTFNLGIILDFYFSSPARARNYLFPIVQKGAKNTIAITNKTFLSKTLHLPVNERAQKDVAEFVYAAREEIDRLKQLTDKYKTQKRGLMQKMMTGEWRVKPDIVNQYMEAQS
ncbi:MAG: restriction endonuclease subunit S [Acidobacteriota bacterium]|jgi:type I restriction enzyme S subunit|nr:restriction endonuclease subunit S [Acidobacteriota bacterium]